MSPKEIAERFFPPPFSQEHRDSLVASILVYGHGRYREGREDGRTLGPITETERDWS